MTPDPKEDRLLDHHYDGIQEYDNPMPRWWVYIFYATIVYAVLYFINLPGIGIGTGEGRIANYEREVAAANARRAAEEAKHPKLEISNASLMAASHDPQVLARGKLVFTTNCIPCHREDGGGNIGPNLTDDFWIHGGRPVDLHATVTTGVLEKGMPAWGTMLKPAEIHDVVAYVLSIHDTHPKDPRAPQGEKVDREDDAAASQGHGGDQ